MTHKFQNKTVINKFINGSNLQSYSHNDDVMSLAFCRTNQLIYTGGHDGSLIAWNLETGYVKFYLHDYDPTCMSKGGNYIKESKSVDCV